MVQILPQTRSALTEALQGLGSGFGNAIGKGVSTHLDTLAKHKLKEVTQRATAKKLTKGLPQLSDEQAELIADFDGHPETQRALFQMFLSQGHEEAVPQQQEQQPDYGQFAQQQQPGNLEQLFQGLHAQGPLQGRQPGREAGLSLLAPEQQQALATQQNLQDEQLGQALQPQMQQQRQLQAQPQVQAQPKPQAPVEQEFSPKQLEKAKKLEEAFMTPAERNAQRRIEHQERKDEEKRIATETKTYVEKINKDNDFAEFSEPRFKKMKSLIEKGGLPISSFYTIFKSVEEHPEKVAGAGALAGAGLGSLAGGIGAIPGAAAGGALGALMGPLATLARSAQRVISPNTEAYEKLSATFLRGAKDMFGGRFTNEEMKAYLAMVPTLANTDKGKLDIIEDAELFNKAARIKHKAYQQVLKENKGKRPADLVEQVEAKSKKQLDDLSEIFRKDIIKAAEDIEVA